MAVSKRPVAIKTGTATAQSGTTEITLTGLPDRIALLAVDVNLDSGSGATVAPVIGTATDPDGAGIAGRLYKQGTAAAFSTSEELFRPAILTDGKLYLRPVCNAAADNVVSYRIAVEAL